MDKLMDIFIIIAWIDTQMLDRILPFDDDVEQPTAGLSSGEASPPELPFAA
jgi:hypothetical protein